MSTLSQNNLKFVQEPHQSSLSVEENGGLEQEDVQKLVRLYSACSPLIFEQDLSPIINLPVEELESLFDDIKHPMKGSYQKRFFKILSEKLAERDVYSDNVFYCLAEAMQHTSDTFYRFYTSKKLRNPIIIEERTQAISQGTTGLSTWSAAYLLSNYLLQLHNDLHASVVSNRKFRILELGAGCGLAGITVASHFPNVQLSTTDCDENVLQQLKANVKLNFGPENVIHEVKEMDWLKASENDLINEKFDMIIAADVIYDPEVLEAFLNTVILVLQRNPEAGAVLVFKERNPDTFKLFMDTLAKSRLKVTMKARTSSTDPFETKILTENEAKVMDNIMPPDELLNNFWIFEMRLKEGDGS